jgi:hypothetical protein
MYKRNAREHKENANEHLTVAVNKRARRNSQVKKTPKKAIKTIIQKIDVL